ncbi:MAG: glycosyltransferase family 2 protein [Desulfotalea sp.]
MIFLKILFYCGFVYLVISVSWLALLTVASWFFKTKKNKGSSLLRLGVIIPAHNEEDGIASTIASIKQCNYDQNLLRIIVLADNCTDNTASIARAAGVLCIERTDLKQRGKGQALDWFLKTHKAEYQDLAGLSFVDADVICHPDLFFELSESLSHPDVQVVQGFNGVANPLVNWRTALVTAAFNVFNHLRMAANNKLFGTGMLKGLGMAFETSVLSKYGWPAHSVVEDVEFSMLLLNDNINIHYNPKAIITSEMATTKQQADIQRSRWEGGRFRLAAKMLPELGIRIIKGEFHLLHAFMDLFVFPLALLMIFLLLWIGLSWWLAPLTLPVLLGLFAIIIFYVASGQLQRRMGIKLWLYLGAAPLFILWKVLVYAKMLLHKNKNGGWQRTKRNSELDK